MTLPETLKAARIEAIAREIFADLTGYKVSCFDKRGYNDERMKAERFAACIIAADPLEPIAEALVEALRELSREVKASFHIGETEIRLAIGNTNFQIIQHHLSNAYAALQKAGVR